MSDPDRSDSSRADVDGLRAAMDAVLSVAGVMGEVKPPESFVSAREVAERGYLEPAEESSLKGAFSRYLVRRAALLQALRASERSFRRGGGDDETRRSAFPVALAAATILIREARGWISLADACRPVRKALDEPDPTSGVERKSYARLYRGATSVRRLGDFRRAVRHFRAHRGDFDAAAAGDPRVASILELLDRDLEAIESGGRESWSERMRYRWFSFRRRHHSAWKSVVFGLFRWSGCAIADLRQPGIGPAGPKRVTAEFRAKALETARPGDVFVTRHDDALSNLFLPGFWPHAALYFGGAASGAPGDFLEAKKDGVRFRAAEETLEVDAFIILRPPLDEGTTAAALRTAGSHAGKDYDFVFDFRTSTRLACTEVVYRAYHGAGGLSFNLIETAGRHCLPAEELIQQALQQGFRIVASCGIGKGGWLSGRDAELALHRTRCGL